MKLEKYTYLMVFSFVMLLSLPLKLNSLTLYDERQYNNRDQTLSGEDWKPMAGVYESDNISGFRNYANVPDLKLKVPTEVTVYFNPSDLQGNIVGVFDLLTKQFVYNLVVDYSTKPYITFISNESGLSYYSAFDNDDRTYADFPLGQNRNQARLYINYSKPIESSALVIGYDSNVTLPTSLSISYWDNQKNAFVLLSNNLKPSGTTTNFPKATSDKWMVDLSYSQPLRIVELSFNINNITVNKKGVKFIAIPGNTYSVYLNQEVQREVFSGNNAPYIYAYSPSVKTVEAGQIFTNEQFTPADSDKDGIPNYSDNCSNLANSDQKDVDQNGKGDDCEDFDKDSILNSIDNCSDKINLNQRDTDGDKIGDACDPDESRLTEKFPQVVWGALIFSSLVFILLIYLVVRQGKTPNNNLDS